MSNIRVRGDLDVATADGLRRGGERALLDPACRVVRVDLSEVTFIDAAGLAALIAVRNRAMSVGGEVVLVQPAPCVVRILALTRLSRTFAERPGLALRAL